MARRPVLEIACDRCKRVETQEIPEGEDSSGAPELELTFQDEKTVYQDLCRRCRNACEGYVKSLTKQKDEEPGSDAKPEPDVKKGGLLSRVTG